MKRMKRTDFSAGDRVEIVTDNSTAVGIIMPNETEKVVVKLESGYNIGIDPDTIKSMTIIERYQSSSLKPSGAQEKTKGRKKGEKLTANKDLKNVALLHTGGTIASKVDYRTGGVVARFEPEEILGLFPELRDIISIDSRLIGNMWSEDIRFAHLQIIAKDVIKEVKRGVAGIIITIGTDFMAIIAAGLAFMLQNVPIPVILVGAQRSSDRGSSDAAVNLICAAEFIAQTEFKGVAICMHETQSDVSCFILHPCTTRKMHSSRRDAFRPINTSAIARINYENREIVWLQNKNEFAQRKEKFKPLLKMEEKVGLIKTHPNMFPEQFASYKGFKGLVIEGSGLGHAPTGVPNKEAKIHAKINAALQKLIASGTVVVMTTQTIYGAVQMQVYSRGRELVTSGVIPCKALSETAFVKLAWLLGNYPKEMKKPEKARELIERDFCHEMFYRVEDNTYLN